MPCTLQRPRHLNENCYGGQRKEEREVELLPKEITVHFIMIEVHLYIERNELILTQKKENRTEKDKDGTI